MLDAGAAGGMATEGKRGCDLRAGTALIARPRRRASREGVAGSSRTVSWAGSGDEHGVAHLRCARSEGQADGPRRVRKGNEREVAVRHSGQTD